MKITIESTDKMVVLEMGEGWMPARVWEGTTESGVPVHVFVTRIAPTVQDLPENAEKFREFERDLKEQCKPSAAIATIPSRLIL